VSAPTIGELRQRLVIERASEVADGAGGAIRTWSAVSTVFARIEPLRRRETVADGRSAGFVTHRITIRHRADITGDVRFVSGGARYRVLAVSALDPKRRFLACLCEEEQA
jgi:SPP1 family predicted phage head-tail adaptor